MARKEFEAAELAARFPPRLLHPHKQLVHRLACPPERPPSGTLVVTRWAAMALPPDLGPREVALEVAPRFFDYAAAAPGEREWHLNFADAHLFGFYGGALLAQDELQVAEHPSLASLREALVGSDLPPLTTEGGRPTPVLVRGVERRCEIATDPDDEAGRPLGLYGNRFARAAAGVVERAVRVIDPPTISNIIAMEAPSHGRGDYSRGQIERVLATAFTGFRAACLESRGDAAVVHTGFWGCGAYGGNRTLMALLQLAAGRLAGVGRLVFHAVDEEGRRDLERGRKALAAEAAAAGGSVGALVDGLVKRRYTWGESDGN